MTADHRLSGRLCRLKQRADAAAGTEQFQNIASREVLDRTDVQKRLLLSLYGLGMNTGLKRLSASDLSITFCHLLGFELLPRLKGISKKKLSRVETESPGDYPNLQPILMRPVKWDLIARQYDEMVKYATALRMGTADTEAILRRFTRDNLKHPTYQALLELGKVKRTMFLGPVVPRLRCAAICGLEHRKS